MNSDNENKSSDNEAPLTKQKKHKLKKITIMEHYTVVLV